MSRGRAESRAGSRAVTPDNKMPMRMNAGAECTKCHEEKKDDEMPQKHTLSLSDAAMRCYAIAVGTTEDSNG